jgi:CRP/FNR family transcriptional regulator
MDPSAALADNPFFRQLTSPQREWLASRIQARSLKRGEKVWFEGQQADQFTFVARGRVKFSRTTRGGREAITDLASDGELMCASTVCTFTPYCCSTVALEDETEVLSISRRAMFELIERFPSVAIALLAEVSQRSMHACDRVEQLSSGQVEQRLAALLVKLAQRIGVDRPSQGIWIPVPLSRQDLADMCGTTLETLIRTMTRFRKAGLVRTTSRGFLVSNLGDLERIVQAPRALVQLRRRSGGPRLVCGQDQEGATE